MTHNPIDPESENLYRIIRGEFHENASASMTDDAEFAAAIRQTAQNIQADPFFQADLQTRLRRISPAAPKSARQFFAGIGKNLAWVAAAAVIMFVVSWSIRTLLPQPPVAATAPVDLVITETPSITPTSPSELENSTPAAVRTPIPGEYISPIYPNDTLLVKTAFPTSPTEAKVYIQIVDEALTIENAHAVAEQLGVNGNVYLAASDAPQMTNYYVTDGISRIFLYSPHHFYYISNYQKSLEVTKQDTPTTEEQISIAESYLKDHGLLDFPYRIQTNESVPGLVCFIQLLDGKPIMYGPTDFPQISVQINPEGEIKSLDYNVLFFEESGTYPIISAEDAWQKSLSSDMPKGVESGSRLYPSETNQIWLREYPQIQRVELFGYLEILQPAEANTSVLMFFNNYVLKGNTQGLEQGGNLGQFMQIWGQFQSDKNGNPNFLVEGWQPSTFPDQTLEGVIQRQGDQGYLVTTDKELLIPGLPSDVPDGMKVYVRCIVLETEASLEWSTISTATGGGGGGGGGSGLADLNLERAPTPIPLPTETPNPLPQIGERFDGIQGNPYVTIFKNADGSTKLTAYMNLKQSTEWPGGLSLNLTGDGLAGIEAYHQLPIKIWGSVTEIDQSVPVITVERYEPVYPGIKAQAWLGTLELATLGEKPVLLFTDQSGTQYILNTSLESETKIPQSGMPYVIEGVIYPNQTFEGYPVLTDFLMFGAQGLNGLEDYKPQSLTPMTMDGAMARNESRTITIEQIEVVYYTSDLRYGQSVDPTAPPVYAQPMWRFYGHYDDGDEFEILVQALTDEYLK